MWDLHRKNYCLPISIHWGWGFHFHLIPNLQVTFFNKRRTQDQIQNPKCRRIWAQCRTTVLHKPQENCLRVISASSNFIEHTKEANLLSSTLVKHLECRGNSEAIANKELAFSKYNVEGLLQGRNHCSANIQEKNKKRYLRGWAECRQPKKQQQNGTWNESSH